MENMENNDWLDPALPISVTKLNVWVKAHKKNGYKVIVEFDGASGICVRCTKKGEKDKFLYLPFSSFHHIHKSKGKCCMRKFMSYLKVYEYPVTWRKYILSTTTPF